MDIEILKNGNKLQREREKIERELEIWERDIKDKNGLGYLQPWNKSHAVALESNISAETFSSFRNSAINELKLMLVDIDKKFSEL